MSRRYPNVLVYKATDGWRWHYSRHGRIRADGGQGYSRLIDCQNGMWDSLGIVDGGVEKDGNQGWLYRNTARGHEEIHIRVKRDGGE